MNQAAGSLTLGELAQHIHQVDPAALLAVPRVIRRVIKRQHNPLQLRMRVPHRKTWVIRREALLDLVEPTELGLQQAGDVPEVVLLLAQPDPERLANQPAGLALRRCWRLLFHARIDALLINRPWTLQALRERILRLGLVEFEEIRRVLRAEKFLVDPNDDAAVYREFVAVHLEFRYFAASLLGQYFPSLAGRPEVDALLAEELDAEALYHQTRLEGATKVQLDAGERDLGYLGRGKAFQGSSRINQRRSTRLGERAGQAALKGNDVRAAIYFHQATLCASDDARHVPWDRAIGSLKSLGGRLAVALGLDGPEANRLREALQPLLEHASLGIWPVEARLLYDLQKVCIDHEKTIHAIDLLEWLRTLGKRPLKRELPGQREWLIVKHLRSALGRLDAVRLAKADRDALDDVLSRALAAGQTRLRDFFRPRVETALDAVQLRPENYVERIARKKLIEEVLDRVVAYGYLTIGDLRDAISRNNLKLHDLSGLEEILFGDKLLRLDRAFVDHLDGIYRRGEFYLRWLQRLTALAFGNGVGRTLMLFVLIPFGGSWGTLETFQHIVHPVAHHFEWSEPHLVGWFSVLLLGLFILLLLNFPPFRSGLVRALWWLFQAIKSVIYDLPAFVLGHPWLRALWEHPAVQFLVNWLLKPGLLTLPFTLALLAARHTWSATTILSSAVFLVMTTLLNTRWGQRIEEIFLDWLLHNWERITVELLPGLLRFIWDLFKRGLETIDRLLYSVDEWLRFRTGEGSFSFVAKLVLGFLWFWITYLLRIYINVLIEPHFNPIKHFPAVTVGAKILLPFTFVLTRIMAEPLRPLVGDWAANTIAFAHVWMLPGVFGFLVWEMLSNWRLYAANRAKTLRPVMIGSHGENLRRLLRPGFHSGTIPKLFSRLRRAGRRRLRLAVWRTARKYEAELLHVEESLRYFVEREFVELLKGSQRWQRRKLAVGHMHLGVNAVRLDFLGEKHESPFGLRFTEQAGLLTCEVEHTGWLSDLTGEQRAALTDALAGLYLLSGIDVSYELLAGSLPTPAPSFFITEVGLVVWPTDLSGPSAIYDLKQDGVLVPQSAGPTLLPELDPSRVLFRSWSLPWSEWVAIWEADQQGKSLPVASRPHLLPST